MSLSDRTPTTATRATYYWEPAIYTNRVIEAVKNELICWDAVDTSWESDLKKGDILYIPKTNTVVASEVVVGTKGTALNPFNTAGVSLTINQWWQAPIDIDTMTLRQTHAAMETYAVDESKYAVALKMDSTINALFSSLGGYSTSAYGTDGQTLDDTIILYLVQVLKEANVPKNDWVMIGDPSTLIDMLKIDKLVAATYGNAGPVNNGIIGKSVYGFQFRETNNLTAVSGGTGSYGVLMQKKAIGGAAQMSPETSWREEYKELHQIRFHSEALWGVAEVNDSFGIPFFTRHA
jgi:hypothetical protein